jgi:hypothetical protein
MEGRLMITNHIDTEGNLTVVDDGLDPVPEPLPPAAVAAQAISDEITVRLEPATTIPEIKAAITEGLDAAIISLGG